MKKGRDIMKKFISILLAFALVLGCMPVKAFAAKEEETCAFEPYGSDAALIETTREGAPIRTGPGKNYSTVVSCEAGTVLEKTGTKINRYLHRWYEVTYRNSQSNECYKGYIYSDNTQKHTHQYEEFEYDNVVYKYCDCGAIRIRHEVLMQSAPAMAIANTAAGTLAVADGPLPAGELIAVGLMITTYILYKTGALPTVEEVQEVYADIDFDQLDNSDGSCPIDSYRRVSRAGGTLTYLDDKCMSIVEAYVWVRTGNDVWCSDWDTAYKLAALYPKGCFSEVDSGNKDYWYHFHLGTCTPNGRHQDVVGGHIFYGTSIITHRLPV